MGICLARAYLALGTTRKSVYHLIILNIVHWRLTLSLGRCHSQLPFFLRAEHVAALDFATLE